MAMPVWRKTRCRILRMAAESSTIRTSDSIGLLTKVLSAGGEIPLEIAAGGPGARMESELDDLNNCPKIPIERAGARMNRQLSQQEIDAVFQNTQDHRREAPA